jgi:hypothetical protein
MSQESIEAAVFRRLLSHLDGRKDIQNIDLMNLAGFCRNCLSKWYAEAAGEQGVTLDKEAAREIVEGAVSDRGDARTGSPICCAAVGLSWTVTPTRR